MHLGRQRPARAEGRRARALVAAGLAALAVGNAVLDVMLAEGFMDGVQIMAKKLTARLAAVAKKHPRS